MRGATEKDTTVAGITGSIFEGVRAKANSLIFCRICKKEIKRSETDGSVPKSIKSLLQWVEERNQWNSICLKCQKKMKPKNERQRYAMATTDPEKLIGRMKTAGVPPRYEDLSPVDNKFATGSYFITAEKHDDDDEEGTGTLKTKLACRIIALRLAHGLRAIFVEAPEMVIKLQSMPMEKKEAYINRIAKYPGLLVLDDVGVKKATPFVKEVYYHIINSRYNYLRDTVITSNLDLEEFDNAMGSRTGSRLTEMYQVIVMQGHDRRLENVPKPIKLKGA